MSDIQKIANELRTMSLSLDDGEFIGTEDSLIAKFNVSKPTLRKAVRILEHEEVVEVRRGLRGGLFTLRPTLNTVVRVAGIYLSGTPGSFDAVPELLDALTPLLVDGVLRSGRLAELAPFAEPAEDLLPHDVFVHRLRSFLAVLFDLAGNLPLSICVSILTRVGLSVNVEKRDGIDTVGQLTVQRTQVHLARAFLAGDRDAAIELFGLRARMLLGGLKLRLEAQRQATRALKS